MSATAEVMSLKDQFLENFPLVLPEGESEKQLDIRRNAFSRLQNLEFPTTRDEYWKYTRVTPILKESYCSDQGQHTNIDIDKYKIEGLDTYTLVYINGYYTPELSTISEAEGLVVLPLSEGKKLYPEVFEKHFTQIADDKKHPFTALNTAVHKDGVFLLARSGAVIDKPVRVLNLTQGDCIAYHPRYLFVAERNSQLKVILSYETSSGGKSFTNAVTEIYVGENASLEHYQLQDKSDANSHIETTHVFQEKHSRFSVATITLRGKIVRNNLNIDQEGEGCESNLSGLYLLTGKQHVDNHTLVDHRWPNSQSNELYKGIMNESSTGVFNGKVFVRQDAQKTNAFQSNQNILLTDDATVYSKPELEIYADDVKCSHGSTTGQLDEEALFYLRSRGLSKDSAKKLLVQAFAADVLETIHIEALKQKIERHIVDRYDNVWP